MSKKRYATSVVNGVPVRLRFKKKDKRSLCIKGKSRSTDVHVEMAFPSKKDRDDAFEAFVLAF